MSPPLSLIFCGTPEFAVPSLMALAADPAFTILAVITQPDRPVGRRQTLTPSAVKAAATELGLTVVTPEKLNAALPELVAQFGRPDVLVVVAYGQILSQAVLDWPRLMPVNVHGSLLPRWRGASPVEHAIVHGDTTTGVTIQRMVKALDAGPILSQRSIPIERTETNATLRAKLAPLGAELLATTLKATPEPVPQDERRVTVCRQLSREDGRVDPTTMTAEDIERRLRAFTPWPGITANLHGEETKIIAAGLTPDEGSVPLSCRDGSTLYLRQVQPAGKAVMAAADWARGRA